MIDIKQFDEIKKTSARSFNDQKALIKKIMAGRVIPCDSCGTTIKRVLPEQSETPGVYCDKGCTSIELEFEG